MITTAGLLILAALTVKTAQTVIVSRWLLFKGAGVARTAGTPTNAVASNEALFWKAFRKSGAARRTRTLWFGVKDLWLEDEIKRESKAPTFRLGVLLVVRVYWRAWLLVPAVSSILVVVAYANVELTPFETTLLFTVGLALLGCMFALGVEMVILMITLGPWLPYYHRLTTLRGMTASNRRVVEIVRLIQVSAGASIITLLAMTGVITFSSVRAGAMSEDLSENGFLGVTQALARSIRVLGTAGDGLDTSTPAGAVLTIVMLPLVLTYIAFLIPTITGVVNVSTQHHSDEPTPHDKVINE